MTIPSIVQAVGASGTGITTVVITVSSTAAGRLLAVIAGANAVATVVNSVTDNIGNTWGRRVEIHTQRTSEIWDSPNAGAGVTTITVTFSAAVTSTTGGAVAFEIQDAATATPSAGTSTGSGSETDTAIDMAVGSFTPSENNTMILAGGWIGANATWTAGSTYTISTTTVRLGTEFKALATAGAETTPLVANYGSSANRTWSMCAVAYKEAAAAGVVGPLLGGRLVKDGILQGRLVR